MAMKNFTLKDVLFLVVLLLLIKSISAQNRWEFPMIFTDNSGISDTVWFIQDESNRGLESSISKYTILDSHNDDFHVYLRKSGDTIWKTRTHPFSRDFSSIGVYAINYQFPITVSWDQNLFDTIIGNYPPICYAKLENPYTMDHDLEGHEIYDYYGWYILGLNTTGPQPPYDENDLQNWDWFNAMYANMFFPMYVTLIRNYTNISETDATILQLDVYPNPVHKTLHLSLLTEQEGNINVSIYNMQGNRINVHYGILSSKDLYINIEDLVDGCYIIEVSDGSIIHSLRFIKI